MFEKVPFVLCLGLIGVSFLFAHPNGHFGLPSRQHLASVHSAQKAVYETLFPSLLAPGYIPLYEGDLRFPYIFSEVGQPEFMGILDAILQIAHEHSEIIFVGRSGNCMQSYFMGYFSEPIVRDLPFGGVTELIQASQLGLRQMPMTPEQRAGLRNHLSENKLSPSDIATNEKPLLIVDLVYTASGVLRLLEELHVWARELSVGSVLKRKLHFFGLFSPWQIAENRLRELQHQMAKDRISYLSSTGEFEKEVDVLASTAPLPGEDKLAQFADRVLSKRISRQLYSYLGREVFHVQESFRPRDWARPFDRAAEISFFNKQERPEFVESLYLFHRGLMDRTGFVAKVGRTPARSRGRELLANAQ